MQIFDGPILNLTAIVNTVFLVSILFVTFETVIRWPGLVSNKFLKLAFIWIDEFFGDRAVNQEILYVSLGKFNFAVQSTLMARIDLIKVILGADYGEDIERWILTSIASDTIATVE